MSQISDLSSSVPKRTSSGNEFVEKSDHPSPVKNDAHSTSGRSSNGLRKLAGFEIVSKLGQGAMGAVFKARQVSLDRMVALKVLPPKIAADQKFIERFQREARVCAKLNHPNIVQGIDVGCDQNLWYFAMEFVDGPTLKELLKTEKKLPRLRVLEIGRQIAEALVCAERNKIVHRDIKPDNILIGSGGEAKLADLGLARKTSAEEEDASLTQPGSAVGTPHYMSPEQVRGEQDKLDTRADIYSLGATLYHLLTGETPFAGRTAAEIMSKHLTEKSTPAHHVDESVGEPLGKLIACMMAKEPRDRIQSASKLVAEFEALIRDAKDEQATGRQNPIRGTESTGPRAPIRGSRTTGPRQPIRATSTGPRSPVNGRAEQGRAVAPSTKPPVLMIAGGAVAALVAVGLGIMVFGGKGDSTSRSKTPEGSELLPKTEWSATPVASKSIEKQSLATPSSGSIGSKAEDKDVLAENAYGELTQFSDLKPEDTKARIQRIQSFLDLHGSAAVAGQARDLLTKLLKDEAAAQEAQKAEQLAKAKEDTHAFQAVCAFDGLEENDTPGRIARLKKFLETNPGADLAKKAEDMVVTLEAQRKKASENADLLAGAQTAWSNFASEYLELLRKGDREAAEACLNKARGDKELASMKSHLDGARKVPEWLALLDQDVVKGAEKLNSLEEFELTQTVGKPIEIGKKSGFKISDVKSDMIYVGNKEISFSIKIASLDALTRAKLRALATQGQAEPTASQVFSALLAMGLVPNAPKPEAIRKMVETAARAGMPKSEMDFLNSLVEIAEKGAVEVRAGIAWSKIQSVAEAKQWAELPKLLKTFLDDHGNTKFAAGKAGDLGKLGKLIEKERRSSKYGSLAKDLVLHMTFDQNKDGGRIPDESGNRSDGKIMGDVHGIIGGRGGQALLFSGTGQVQMEGSERFQWGAADFSLAAWIRTRRDGTIISKAPIEGQWVKRGQCLFIRSGLLFFDSGSVGVAGKSKVTSDDWNHVAVTYHAESREVVVFLNGKKEGSKILLKSEPDPKNYVVRLGYTTEKYGGQFSGHMDDVRVYRRVLGPEEVALLVNELDSFEAGRKATPTGGGAVDQAFLDKVSKLSGEQKFEAIGQKLAQLNPTLDPKRIRRQVLNEQRIFELRVNMRGVTDLSPLRGCVGLQRLYLEDPHGSTWSDLTQLNGLGLVQFFAYKFPIQDIAALEHMPLEELDLGGTRVADLTVLKALPLKRLLLHGTPVADLSPLKGVRLNRLNVQGTKITDLSPLKGMPLSQLNLANTKIADFSALEGMPLSDLDLSGTILQDIEFVAMYPLMSALRLNRTPLAELSPVSGLKVLKHLSIGNTRIKDLDALKGKNLRSIDISGTSISNIGVLQGMVELESVNIKDSQVSDLSPLKGLANLRSLHLAGSKVTNLEPIKGLKINELTVDYRPEFKKFVAESADIGRINRKLKADFLKDYDVDAKAQKK